MKKRILKTHGQQFSCNKEETMNGHLTSRKRVTESHFLHKMEIIDASVEECFRQMSYWAICRHVGMKFSV